MYDKGGISSVFMGRRRVKGLSNIAERTPITGAHRREEPPSVRGKVRIR